MAQITVHISLDQWQPKNDFTQCINIDDFMRHEFMPIDFHDGKDPGTKFLCSAELQKEKQLHSREQFAKYCASELTNAILKSFNSKDTKMGYEIEEPFVLTIEEQVSTIKAQISAFDSLIEKAMYIHNFFKPDPMFTQRAIDIVMGDISRGIPK